MTQETAQKVFETTLNRIGLRGKATRLPESVVITVDEIENKYSIVGPDSEGSYDVYAAAEGRSAKVGEACEDIRSAYMVIIFGVVAEVEHQSAAAVMENIGRNELGKIPHRVMCSSCGVMVEEANFNYVEHSCSTCLGIPVAMAPASIS